MTQELIRLMHDGTDTLKRQRIDYLMYCFEHTVKVQFSYSTGYVQSVKTYSEPNHTDYVFTFHLLDQLRQPKDSEL